MLLFDHGQKIKILLKLIFSYRVKLEGLRLEAFKYKFINTSSVEWDRKRMSI